MYTGELTTVRNIVCRITNAVVEVSQRSRAVFHLSIRIVDGVWVDALACVGCALHIVGGDTGAWTAVTTVVLAGLVKC